MTLRFHVFQHYRLLDPIPDLIIHHTMKRCAFCGGEYVDELERCPLDGQPLDYDVLGASASSHGTPGGKTPPYCEGLDASAIAPRIKQLRKNYTLELKTRQRHAASQRGFLAIARRRLARLPFFHRENPGNEIHNPKA